MASLGVLARLTQQVNENRFREQGFRSALFQQGEDNIMRDRQIRLQESNAIADRIQQGQARQDELQKEAERNKIERERIAVMRDRSRGGSGTGSAGAFIPASSEFPPIGGADPATLGGGLFPGTNAPSGEQIATESVSGNFDWKGFTPQSEADNKTVRDGRVTLNQSMITADNALDKHENLKPKQPRSIKDVEGQRVFQSAMGDWLNTKNTLQDAKTQVAKQLEAANGVKLWEDKTGTGPSSTDLNALAKAEADIQMFTEKLEEHRRLNRQGNITVDGKSISEKGVEIRLAAAERTKASMINRVNQKTGAAATQTKPPAISGGANALGASAASGNADAKKLKNILIGGKK